MCALLHIKLISEFSYQIYDQTKFICYLGTCKIDKNCTSTIKEVTYHDGKIKAEVCYTHYGHNKDLHHTWLSQRQRQQIAAKLQQGITREKILDDVR